MLLVRVQQESKKGRFRGTFFLQFYGRGAESNESYPDGTPEIESLGPFRIEVQTDR